MITRENILFSETKTRPTQQRKTPKEADSRDALLLYFIEPRSSSPSCCCFFELLRLITPPCKKEKRTLARPKSSVADHLIGTRGRVQVRQESQKQVKSWVVHHQQK